MDFKEAMIAHTGWMSEPSTYLRPPDGSLNALEIARDDACALGKWIHGEGRRFCSASEIATLQAEHAAFHKAAADVVRRADAGGNIQEEVVLGSKSVYAANSTKVIQHLMQMERMKKAA